jgi:hypothetical protein
MVAKLTKLTHKIAIQLHLVAEFCTICSSLSRRPIRKLLDTSSCEIKAPFYRNGDELQCYRIGETEVSLYVVYLLTV